MFEKPLKYGLFLVGIITVINLVIIGVFSIAWHNLPYLSFLQFIYFFLTSFISAFIVSLAVLFTAPVLKDYLATFRRLLRLESFSHPLLLKLSLEAPGTYHHSLTVANLAYKAAKAIKADSLLTRIGGYYHDIGKVENPAFYIENQKKGENSPHENIKDPKKSAQIIIGHVKYGIKLGKEYNLPTEVIAFIPEHHGTSRIKYFFELAKKMGLKPREKDFSYPGPKPLSLETAILMLADVIEAKIRLLDKVDKEKITRTVNEAVREKIKEKQLELSGLTQHQLDEICQSFIETLCVMHHQRIKYPQKEKPYAKFDFKFKHTKKPEE